MSEVLEKDRVIKIIKDFVKELLSTGLVSVREIYIYGSYVYGNPDQWSDIDIAILSDCKLPFEELIDIEAKVRQLARKFDSRIEPIIFTCDPLGFIENEVKRGIRIYPEV